MNNDKTWLDIFKPCKIAELDINVKAVRTIVNWINNFEMYNKAGNRSTYKSCLLLMGNHGIGKSVTIKVILDELGYNIYYLSASDIKNSKNASEFMHKVLNNCNIMQLLQKQIKKTAIIVDELEAITVATDKQFVLAIQKINEQNWLCPVIFISNNQHNKLLSDIKKIAFEIRFWPPSQYDMKKILLKVCRNKKINLDNRVIDVVIGHAQDDIRRLIFILQDLKFAYKGQLVTLQKMTEYCKISKTKDVDIDLYKATNGLLFDYHSVNDCLRYYETEKVLLPLMMHQNWVKTLDNTNYQLIPLTTIAESLSNGDVIENYIYSDQTWDLQEIHGFYTCVMPSFYLSHKAKTNFKRGGTLEFAKDLNRTSIKKINKKNINITDKIFKNMNIFDYIYINKIIRKLIADKNVKDCVNLLRNYNIELKYLESLLKIDKIEDNKTILTSRQKSEFSNLINNKSDRI